MTKSKQDKAKCCDIEIRDFIPGDYQAVAEIRNAVDPDYAETTEIMADKDTRRDPKCKHHRWVATCNRVVVGTGLYTQLIEMYKPDRFTVVVQVLPDHQNRGIGTMLYNHITTHLQSLNPAVMRSYAREDWTAGVHMLESHGFVEYWRMSDSYLDVKAFDPTPYTGLVNKLQKEGVEIKTYRELENDPKRDRKLYDLEWELIQDVPDADEFSRPDFETFVRDRINSPESLLDGNFVAVHGDKYVGMSELFASPANGWVKHGMTGVIRTYRRRGIALTLKLRAIDYAKVNGHPVLLTLNDIENPSILALNYRLGFAKQPDCILYEKKCSR